MSIFHNITHIGDKRTEYDELIYDDINDITKNDIISVLDIIQNYPSHQCCSVTKILNTLFPGTEAIPNRTANLLLRMFIPQLSVDHSM